MKAISRVVLVGDHITRDTIKMVFMSNKLVAVQFAEFDTELHYKNCLESIIAFRPDIILISKNLPWTNPSPDMQLPPEEIAEQGSATGGLRCARATREKGSAVPIAVFHSSFDSLPNGYEIVEGICYASEDYIYEKLKAFLKIYLG